MAHWGELVTPDQPAITPPIVLRPSSKQEHRGRSFDVSKNQYLHAPRHKRDRISSLVALEIFNKISELRHDHGDYHETFMEMLISGNARA